LLVSAYDIINAGQQSQKLMIAHLEQSQSAGVLVLLDSGNYESFRKQDKAWQAEKLHEAFEITPHDIAFCFDDLNPPNDVEGVLRAVVESMKVDQAHSTSLVLPIVHAPRTTTGDIIFDLIPELMRRVSRELRPELIAIPERELGDGILAR